MVAAILLENQLPKFSAAQHVAPEALGAMAQLPYASSPERD